MPAEDQPSEPSANEGAKDGSQDNSMFKEADDYIAKLLANNIPEDKIVQAMGKAGWPTEVITNRIKLIKSMKKGK